MRHWLQHPIQSRAHRRRSWRVETLEPRTVLSASSTATVVINEFGAENHGLLLDENGDSSDWIEIRNTTAAPFDLGRWFLTDDALVRDRWAFPVGTTLAPGELLVVFASGKNRTVPGSPLHTNFQLNDTGEYLALVTPEEVVWHSYGVYPPQRPDVSYGLVDAGSTPDLDSPRYFTSPSPGGSNDEEHSVLGFVAAPTFTVPHGFQQTAFTTSLAVATSAATIYVTLDGSVPSPTNPQASVADPLVPLTILQTSTVRAAAYRNGWAPSPVTTQTYVFVSDVLTQSPTGQAPAGWPSGSVNGQVFDYGMDPDIVNHPVWGPQLAAALTAIPSVSLVTDRANLFDPATGVYVNAQQHGDDWEQPVSVELLNPDGTPGFQIDGGLRIRGGFSRVGANPKHAFRLFFRDEYGDDTLNYPLFGDEGVSAFRSFDLRTDQNDSWAYQFSREMTMIHDVFSRDTQGALGRPYTRSRFYHLYLNGQYWGLYQSQERPEADFAAEYFGGLAADYDVVKAAGPSGNYATEATDGDLVAWRQLWDAARAGVAEIAAFNRLQGLDPDGSRNPALPVLIDIDNLIDYMLIIFFTGDEDAPLSMPFGNNRSNNWFASRNRNGQEGFRFFIHDAEQTFFSNHNIGDLSTDRVGPFTGSNQNNFTFSNPQWIHQDLMASAEYRRRFADRAHQMFFDGGVFTFAQMSQRWYARANEVSQAILGESARWGDAQRPSNPFTKDDWQYAVDNVAQRYFAQRIPIVLDQLRGARWPNPAQGNQLVAAPLYPSVPAPQVTPLSGQYQTGTPITATLPPTESYADTVLVAARAPSRSFVPRDNNLGTSWTQPSFNDTAWIAGTTGVGYETSPTSVTSYSSLIGTNVQSQMFGLSNSVFLRTNFTLTGSEQFDRLLLRMKFDDGFVAYLDGVEVARSGNTPRGTPPWDETAGSRDDNVALKYEQYDLSHALASLGPGSHVLAIHGLNASANNSDMIIMPELIGRRVSTSATPGTIYYTLDGSDPWGANGQPSPTAQIYSGSFPLAAAGTLKTRTLSTGTWSALSETTYGTRNDLRITEIMYNPPPQSLAERMRTPGGSIVYDGDEYEFVELYNAGDVAIPLAGMRFSDGIQITFTTQTLPPGTHGLVVRNQAAFENRYGAGHLILAEYGGTLEDYRLSNAGENLVFSDAAGGVLQQVAYDDANGWPATPDGAGMSLVTVHPHGYQTDLDDPVQWRASHEPLGSPGMADVLRGDFDGDGRIGLRDLRIIQAHFGQTSGATHGDGDFTGDGAVNRLDLVHWLPRLGRTAATFSPSPPAPSAAPSASAAPQQKTSTASSLGVTSLAAKSSRRTVLPASHVDAIHADTPPTARPATSTLRAVRRNARPPLT